MTTNEKENGKKQDANQGSEEDTISQQPDQKKKDEEWQRSLQSLMDSLEDEVCH